MNLKQKLKKPAIVLVWLFLWQIASVWLGHELLLVSPLRTAETLLGLMQHADYWMSIGMSLYRIMLGFALAFVFGTILAFLAWKFHVVHNFWAPMISVMKATPVASFIILALVWLSSKSLAMFISALMVFPPVYLNVLEGIRQTDKKLLEMAKVFRVPLWRQVRGIYLPQVLPYFRTAVSLALGLCWKAGIAAEVIGLPTGSLGEHLYNAKVYYMTPDLFAWTAVIVMVSAVFERAFLRVIDALVGKAGAK